MEKRSIAIDGPAGTGKSTLAKMTAKHFGLIYVDTGALYRTIGLHVLRCGVGTRDIEGVTALLPSVTVDMRYDGEGMQRMLLSGEDVTEAIRSPEASIAASDVSAMPPVRAFLLSMQRDMAEKYDVVMDGRDIGTVVLPGAGLKIFLTASPEVRAQRRYKELLLKGTETTYEDVLRDMAYRDKNDSERATAPLKAAEDAVRLDTTEMNLDECFEAVCRLMKEKLGLKK
jgi:cytidylate kinase